MSLGGMPPNPIALEEYRYLVEEARFLGTRYMQFGVIYLAFVGFAIKEIFSTGSSLHTLLLACFSFCLNFVAYFIAYWVKRMMDHAFHRATNLADHLGLQRPHSMKWVFCISTLVFAGGHVLFAILIVLRFLDI